MTKSASWDRVRELYLAALEREEGHRAAFLREACAGDETLFREVLSLLSGVRSVRASPDSPVGGMVPDVAGARVSSTASGAKAPPPLSTLGPGERLTHYEIVSRFGAEGMGEVCRARDLKLGRDVAIKLMHKSLSSKPDRLRRFEREARAAAALNHPSIATIYAPRLRSGV